MHAQINLAGKAEYRSARYVVLHAITAFNSIVHARELAVKKAHAYMPAASF
jgi:hypothetical protein